jgi:phospholipid/cholesterol/gamma-HCH transport system permease protein
MQALISEPVLTATPSGNQLELNPGGAWVAANVASLERLTEAVAPELDRSSSLRVDMTGVKDLDTLGAWLLEKLSRRAT